MKVIFIIWLAFTVMTFLFGIFGSIIAVQRYEKKHPNEKLPCPSPVERIIALLRSIIMSALPIFHIILFFAFLFAWDKVVERTVEIFENKA
jgi:TRAP-type C4-dicarboxylate transport system permease small subunit